MKHCIHEPDDRCVDCSPNCPNSDAVEPEEQVRPQDLVELEIAMRKGGAACPS